MMSELPTAQTLAEATALLQALWAENARLQATVAQLAARVQALEAQLGQTSTNSSRPPLVDPPAT